MAPRGYVCIHCYLLDAQPCLYLGSGLRPHGPFSILLRYPPARVIFLSQLTPIIFRDRKILATVLLQCKALIFWGCLYYFCSWNTATSGPLVVNPLAFNFPIVSPTFLSPCLESSYLYCDGKNSFLRYFFFKSSSGLHLNWTIKKKQAKAKNMIKLISFSAE